MHQFSVLFLVFCLKLKKSIDLPVYRTFSNFDFDYDISFLWFYIFDFKNNDDKLGFLHHIMELFDTINHILLAMPSFIGFNESAVNLVSNYLSVRKQCVVIEGYWSDPLTVISGETQGSILGPVLFIIYTSKLALSLNTDYNLYADFTQLNFPFKIEDMPLASGFIHEDLNLLIL